MNTNYLPDSMLSDYMDYFINPYNNPVFTDEERLRVNTKVRAHRDFQRYKAYESCYLFRSTSLFDKVYNLGN